MWEEVCFISESGRISKLLMLAGGRVVASYDRGWDIRPAGGDIQGIYKALLERWN